MKKLPNLRRELRSARQYVKMFIPGSCDIRFLWSNIRIEANNVTYDMELQNQDFEAQVERHDEITKFEEGVENSACVNLNVHAWPIRYRILVFKHANRS